MFILRHGETTWNTVGRMQGRLDSPLTPLGRLQAERQGEILRAAATGSCSVYSSPQVRAVETARIALPGREIRLDDRLAELGMGEWQGRTLQDIRGERPDVFEDPHPFRWKFRAPGGETEATMTTRVAGFLSEIPEPAIVVTHGVTSQLLRGLMLGMDVAAMAALEDRQGVVYQVAGGRQILLEPPG